MWIKLSIAEHHLQTKEEHDSMSPISSCSPSVQQFILRLLEFGDKLADLIKPVLMGNAWDDNPAIAIMRTDFGSPGHTHV